VTVCVGIKVHDCIVFAADSASSLIGINEDGSSAVINVWRHGTKVFNLHKCLPIAAMTCGMGHIGPASISTLAKDLRKSLTKEDGVALATENYSIQEVVDKAHAFFAARYNELAEKPANPHIFEFWIGGIGSDGLRGEAWKLAIQDGHILDPMLVASQDDDDRIFWGGQPGVINRLLLGFDEKLFEVLAETGSDADSQAAFVEELRARASTPLVHAAMPVQDAIALADFLVDVTKRYFAFLPGADVVGGDTDVATVTKHEGFKWIRRKHYYSPSLNPRETDHV
jgi:hypothetical protein